MNIELLDLLKNNARMSVADLAAMTKLTEAEVVSEMHALEDAGVILKYAAITDPMKDPARRGEVRAEIEVQVTPERERGFDALAERIYRYPQVKTLMLMSGGYDLKVVIEGESLQDVAHFVARKLSSLEGVKSTKTHFLLKAYKENDVLFVAEPTDTREGATA
jgi:DNA-binding Lrp family transcriptional regulator